MQRPATKSTPATIRPGMPHIFPSRGGWILVLALVMAGLGLAGLGPAQAALPPAGLAGSVSGIGSARDDGRPDTSLRYSPAVTTYTYLPFARRSEDVCRSTGETYGTLPVNNWQPADRPAEQHGDLNLALRGHSLTNAALGLVNVGGGGDPSAPQLAGVFKPARAPSFKAVYRVNDWDWGCNCRGGPIEDWEVTLAGLTATPAERVTVPNSGYDIGAGYKVLVLYASRDRIALKYTGEDTVVGGYTIHLENICVDSSLLALYQTQNNAGRHELPALRAGQAVGRAAGDWVGVAIRDNGTFLDPRSGADWWRGY